jgi:hypothetical protein
VSQPPDQTRSRLIHDEEEDRSLGAMVTEVRLLEWHTCEVARALGVRNPAPRGMMDVLREARRQARKGLPPWSRDVELTEVEAWLTDVSAIMDIRNRYVHWQSVAVRGVDDDEWVDRRLSFRSGQHFVYTSDGLESATAKATELNDVGHFSLMPRLLIHIRDGIYAFVPRSFDPPQIWAWSRGATGDDDVEDLSAEHIKELLLWLVESEFAVGGAWHSWLDERYAEQDERRSS